MHLSLALLALAAACAQTPPPASTPPVRPSEQPAAAAADLADLVRFMTGRFSSEEQSRARSDEFMPITLAMTRIWESAADGAWIYVEQAVASMPDRPYRQRVYRVSEPSPGVFLSEVFTLPGDPLAFAGAAADPSKLADLTPERLALREGCSITLRREADGRFVGGTRGNTCASDLRGASYATSEVEIGPDGMKTLDRGYDADGKQVWGSEHGPYDFRRLPG